MDNVAQKLYPLGSIQRAVYRNRVAEIEEQYRNARNSPKETSSSASGSGSSSSQLNSSPDEDASSATSRSPAVPAQAQGNGKIENIKNARSCAEHDKTSFPSFPSPPCFASAPSPGVDFFEPNGTHLNLEFEDLSDLLHDKSTFGKGSLELFWNKKNSCAGGGSGSGSAPGGEKMKNRNNSTASSSSRATVYYHAASTSAYTVAKYSVIVAMLKDFDEDVVPLADVFQVYYIWRAQALHSQLCKSDARIIKICNAARMAKVKGKRLRGLYFCITGGLEQIIMLSSASRICHAKQLCHVDAGANFA